MQLSDIVRGKRVAVFLHEKADLIDAIQENGASGVALYSRSGGGQAVSGAIARDYTSHHDVARNNAEVLFLDGPSVTATGPKDLRYIRHATWILIRRNLHAALMAFSLRRHVVRRRLEFAGIVSLRKGSSNLRWLAFKNVSSQFPNGPCFYFSSESGARSFFSGIRDLNYCVVSGVHQIPQAVRNERLKLLVHNENAEELTCRVTHKLGFSPVEIYTPFSVPGHSLTNHVSYFPPMRSLDLLKKSAEGNLGERRIPVRDQLLAFCYHLLFHDNHFDIGTQDQIRKDTWKTTSVYPCLMALCDKAGVRRFSRIGEIEDLLRQENWFPSTETLAFIARENQFVRERYLDFLNYKPGLAVFVIREIAAERGLLNEIRAMVEAAGFEILKSGPIPAELQQTVIAEFRGGNWSLPPSAGLPIYFMITFDPDPKPVDTKLFVDAVATDNGRLIVKREIRKKAARLAGMPSFNALHSSDNSRAALEYVKILSPEIYARCEALVRQKS